jgi:DNA invertase Pin-like site-specific DNA recombinase
MSKRRNAVSYIRVSGLGQRDGDGPQRQRDAVARSAKAQRLDLVREFSDLGVSGTIEGVDRPGMRELLAGLEGVDVVLVESADRLARDLVVQELLLRLLDEAGVVVLDSHGTDLTVADGNPTKVLVRQILGAVQQFDRSSIVAKLRRARDIKRAATGRCEGLPPFGELDGEAEALAELRKLARKPRGCDRPTYAEIARRANEAGIRSRSGKPWTRGTVHNVLRRAA